MRNPREIILREMALLGYPIDTMTDEQIEQATMEFGKLLASSGFTPEQVRYVLRELNPTSGK
jgi:spermidine/putrescine-binding protein